MEAPGAAVIVVDTNVVPWLVIPGAGTPVSELVRDRDATWAAPALLRSGFRNVQILAAFPETAVSPEAFVSH